MRPETITALQLQLRVPTLPRTRGDYKRVARWWELEAMRGASHEVEPGEWVRDGKRTFYRPGVTSAQKSAEYARNMRWAAEMALLYGAGTWLELKARREAAWGGA